MKILFIVQGEGRGHLTQAITLEQLLRRHGHEVVEVLVGESKSRHLPGFFNRSIQAPVKRFSSPNFQFSQGGRSVSLSRSILQGLLKLPTYLRSMSYINQRIRETRADIVVNFYELLTGLTYLLFRPRVPQVCIGHQYLFLHSDFKFPATSRLKLMSLRLFTRLTCIGAYEKLALSFRRMDDDLTERIRVVPPLLRQEVLAYEAERGNYLHGYLLNAAYGEEVCRWHAQHPEIGLHFFWDKSDEDEVCEIDEKLSFHQIDDAKFLRYMAGCKAYATTAGFESVCEAMYLGKPLLMVPVHIEQECNAFDAASTGAGIISDSFNLSALLDFAQTYHPDTQFRYWVRSGEWCLLRVLEDVYVKHTALHMPLPTFPR